MVDISNAVQNFSGTNNVKTDDTKTDSSIRQFLQTAHAEKFIHFSHKIIKKFKKQTQPKSTQEHKNLDVVNKPRGLFASKGSKWFDWCTKECFYPNSYRFIYEVEVDPDSKILVITPDTINEFVAMYNIGSNRVPFFNWEEVSKTYDGVHFTQHAMDLIYGPNVDCQIWRKFSFLCHYDVETLVLLKGNHHFTLLQEI